MLVILQKIHKIMIQNLVYNLCESFTENIGGMIGVGKKPTPIIYLTQWKIVGNSEVHGVGNLTSWKVSGNSVVQDGAIMSCGDLGQDGKYHVKISNGVTVYDIPLDAPLRKVNDVADTIEFTNNTVIVTRNIATCLLSSIPKWLRWSTAVSGKTRYVSNNTPLANAVLPPNTATTVIALCSIYRVVAVDYVNNANVGISAEASGRIGIYDADYAENETNDAFIEHIQGAELLYQLATPTTEIIQVPDIAVSPTDTYTSANVVPYSAFEHTENKEIWSCGEYNPIDGKYHILVQPQGGSIADIALDEPLRKVNDVADSIEFPVALEAFCNTDGSQIQTTLPDDTILHIQNLVTGINNISTSYLTVTKNNNGSANVVGENNSGSYQYANVGTLDSIPVFRNTYFMTGIAGGSTTKYDVRYGGNLPCYNKDNLVKVTTTSGQGKKVSIILRDGNNIDATLFFLMLCIDDMFADAAEYIPANASDFRAMFPNLTYIENTANTIDVIVKGGKLYKYVETEGKALVTRNIISRFIGNCTITRANTNITDVRRWQVANDAKKIPSSNRVIHNILSNKFSAKSANQTYTRTEGVSIDAAGAVLIYTSEFTGTNEINAFKEANADVEIIYELNIPTTELVDAPQIEEADSYSMVISQGGKAVEWSSFETE